jgi:hypothetical protein
MMSGMNNSPAYHMASRIRAEQGNERAAQYLGAMEPFIAPAERAHIAEKLGLRLPESKKAHREPEGDAGYFGMQNGGGANLLQLMQMMQGMGGKGGGSAPGGGGMNNPAQLAQVLGSLLGRQKNNG